MMTTGTICMTVTGTIVMTMIMTGMTGMIMTAISMTCSVGMTEKSNNLTQVS